MGKCAAILEGGGGSGGGGYAEDPRLAATAAAATAEAQRLREEVAALQAAHDALKSQLAVTTEDKERQAAELTSLHQQVLVQLGLLMVWLGCGGGDRSPHLQGTSS